MAVVSGSTGPYLDYLDKEMTIQGILSAFCVAVGAAAFDRILGVKKADASGLVANLQYFSAPFVLAAIIAGLAGALYVPQVGIINPSEMATDKSLEAIVWVSVGGRGTLIGPVIGAVAVNAMKSWATRAYPDLWLMFLGLTFILVTLFMPKGIVGLPAQLGALKRRWQRPKADETEMPMTAKAEALVKPDLK